MKPLHIGTKMKLSKVEEKILGSSGAAPMLIDPKGPKLNLAPIGDRFFITSPDKGQENPDMVGGVHLPPNSQMRMIAYAEVTVLSVGPDVKGIEKGDCLLVLRPQCQKIVYLGNEYWWTTSTAVMGIISRQVP